MSTPPSSTLALPPALTYLLSRALGDRRRTARLGGLCRDTARYLASAGATRAEIEAALADAVAVVGTAPDPTLRAVLDDVTAHLRATVAG